MLLPVSPDSGGSFGESVGSLGDCLSEFLRSRARLFLEILLELWQLQQLLYGYLLAPAAEPVACVSIFGGYRGRLAGCLRIFLEVEEHSPRLLQDRGAIEQPVRVGSKEGNRVVLDEVLPYPVSARSTFKSAVRSVVSSVSMRSINRFASDHSRARRVVQKLVTSDFLTCYSETEVAKESLFENMVALRSLSGINTKIQFDFAEQRGAASFELIGGVGLNPPPDQIDNFGGVLLVRLHNRSVLLAIPLATTASAASPPRYTYAYAFFALFITSYSHFAIYCLARRWSSRRSSLSRRSISSAACVAARPLAKSPTVTLG
ncbi:hypothetical protein MMC11_008457 [Xylographa trunciseda]|nr:hypothetical protein [Xylographa trunciseda]